MAKIISLVTLCVFSLQFIFNMSPFVLTTDIENYHSYQLITHLLLHKDLENILSNLILFIVVAKEVENYYKDDIKFLTLYLSCGIVSALSQMIAYTGESITMAGASGAIFGVLGATLLISPYQKLNLLGFKIPFMIIGIILILPEIASCFMYSEDGIGHFAHVGGFIAGMIFYFFNRK
jgi:membrane associated rhomboid family serine protease